jgi:tetratricopeptide (TPR) repeat protein
LEETGRTDPFFRKILTSQRHLAGCDGRQNADSELEDKMARRAIRCVEWAAALLAFFTVAQACAQQDSPANQEAASLEDQARKLDTAGQYQEAIAVTRRALALREKTSGPDHPDVAISLQLLGSLEEKAGSYPAAKSTYQRALAIRERALGPEHQDTGTALIGLANLHVLAGEYANAEPLYQRALPIVEKTFGAEHLETSKALAGLANVYSQNADYERAEPLYQRALGIRERLFGPEHLSVTP